MGEFRLNYKVPRGDDGKIIRTRPTPDAFDIETVDVTWTHADGFPPHKVTVPVSFDYATKQTTFEERDDGPPPREIKDMVSVKPSDPDSIVIAILEAKREGLAAALGVKP